MGMETRPVETGRESWLALLAPNEEPLIRSSAEILGAEVHVVRTRRELERGWKGCTLCVVGDDQPVADRISAIRQVHDAHDARPIVVTERDLHDGLRILREGGGPATTVTGAAGLAGLLHVARRPELRRTHGLTESSRVLLVITEGPVVE